MHSKIPHLIKAVQSHPWAILPERLEAIVDVLRQRANGIELASPGDARRSQPVSTQEAVAIIQVFGILGQRLNMVQPMSGPATSTEQVGNLIDRFVQDSMIKAIVLQIDSPGGEVYGTAELAARIMAARQQKPIIAFADSLAASAAYWIGSAASQFWMTPSGEVGSIGVYAVHYDQSKANEVEGITPTYVSAGEFKLEGNPDAPLSDAARAAMQARVNEYYNMFVGGVAQGRGVSASLVRSGFGRGRVVGATEALGQRMVDRIGTLPDILASISGRALPGRQARALGAPGSSGAIDIRRRRLHLIDAEIDASES